MGLQALARALLALARRLDELSALLLLDGTDSDGGPPGFLEDGEGLTSSRRLGKLVGSWVYVVEFLVPKIPRKHPFLRVQEERMKKIRETLLIDLKSALKEARRNESADTSLELLGMFAELGAEGEAVRAMREVRR
jgi:hemoglobin-like flavoprotein